MQTLADITKIIEQDNVELTSKMFRDLIKEHKEGDGQRQEGLYERYTQKSVPIMERTVATVYKVNYRTANDFYGDVCDTKAGYMGNEVTVDLQRDNYGVDDEFDEADFTTDRAVLADFRTMNSTVDGNSEMVKLAAICGIGYRLLYVGTRRDEDNDVVRLMNLDPWEIIYIYDRSIHEPQYVLRYYEIHNPYYRDANDMANAKEYVIRVEWYDDVNITYYLEDNEGNYHLDTTEEINPQPHLFDGIPIVPFANNEELLGEPEKAISLIDAYDDIMSDTTSEIGQLRLAYLYAKGAGMKIDADLVKTLEQTGIFPLKEDGEVGFITKELAIEAVKEMLMELRRNIYAFSKSIDLSEDIGADMRVIGWQVRLLKLENSAMVTERKFIKALREQYRMLTAFWKKYRKGTDVNYLDLVFLFQRNFPRDIAQEAKTLIDLLATVSRKTAYAQMSFIDEPEREIAAWEKEQEAFGLPDLSQIEDEEETENATDQTAT